MRVLVATVAGALLACQAQPSRPVIEYADHGATSFEGCPTRHARVTTANVDVCVALYEAGDFEAFPTELSAESAHTYCERGGTRLCSEREWEAACRGPIGSLYPYGETYDANACNTESDRPVTNGTRNRCRSGFGVYDLSGNGAEWVAGGLLKGGDHTADAFGARCGARIRGAARETTGLTTARCCADPQ